MLQTKVRLALEQFEKMSCPDSIIALWLCKDDQIEVNEEGVGESMMQMASDRFRKWANELPEKVMD